MFALDLGLQNKITSDPYYEQRGKPLNDPFLPYATMFSKFTCHYEVVNMWAKYFCFSKNFFCFGTFERVNAAF